jgi:hypothetical protein
VQRLEVHRQGYLLQQVRTHEPAGAFCLPRQRRAPTVSVDTRIALSGTPLPARLQRDRTGRKRHFFMHVMREIHSPVRGSCPMKLFHSKHERSSFAAFGADLHYHPWRAMARLLWSLVERDEKRIW